MKKKEVEKKTLEREDLDIITIAKKHRTKTLAKISISIDKQSTTISKTIVRRRLNEQGLYKLQLLKKLLLSDTHRDNRLEWAKKNKKTDWSKIIFIDKITISQFSKPKKIWRYKSEKVKALIVKHFAKVHIYRCFSEKGFGNIYCFTENLNSELLCTIYKKALLPSTRNFFGEDDNSWKLQEDNDPKHTSGKVQEWKDNNDINKISWPSQSPDLNLMENVWAVLKANVSNYKPTSVKHLIKIIKREWKKLDGVFAKNLVLSMKNRISLIINNEGDHILY